MFLTQEVVGTWANVLWHLKKDPSKCDSAQPRLFVKSAANIPDPNGSLRQEQQPPVSRSITGQGDLLVHNIAPLQSDLVLLIIFTCN